MHLTLVKNFYLTLSLLLLSLLIFLVDKTNLFYWPKLGVSVITEPIQKQIFGFSSKIAVETSYLFKLKQIVGDYQNLENDYAVLVGQNTKLNQIVKENEILKKQLAIIANPASNLIFARVLGVSRYLILDKGQADRIQKNQIVVLENNFIGKVVNAGSNSSQVIMPTDVDFKTPVEIENKNIKAQLTGEFGSTMVIEKILPEESISEGDLVLSSGEGLNEQFIPKGLVVGKITRIEKDQSGLFKKATVIPVFNYNQLSSVFIILAE